MYSMFEHVSLISIFGRYSHKNPIFPHSTQTLVPATWSPSVKDVFPEFQALRGPSSTRSVTLAINQSNRSDKSCHKRLPTGRHRCRLRMSEVIANGGTQFSERQWLVCNNGIPRCRTREVKRHDVFQHYNWFGMRNNM